MNTLNLPISVRAKSLMLFTSLAAMAAVPALAQTSPVPVTARPMPVAPAPRPLAQPPLAQPPVAARPGAAGTQPQATQAVPAPASLPPPLWDMVNAEDLLHYIQQIGAEGLNPADYDPEGWPRPSDRATST